MEIKRCYDTIIGASVAENQLVAITSDKSKTEGGVTFTDNRDGTYTVYTDSNGATSIASIIGSTVNAQANHVYMWRGTPTGGSLSTYMSYAINSYIGINGFDYGSGLIQKATGTGLITFVLARVMSGTVITTPIVFKPQFFDLTAKFGSTIADYLYSLESATAGAGVAKLREWGFLTDEYIPYNPGSLESVEATAHKMVGFNQWDEEWENGRIYTVNGATTSGNGIISKNYIRIVPSTTYHIQAGTYGDGTAIRIFYYDADKQYISYISNFGMRGDFTTPANACYIRFNIQTTNAITTYNHDICINLSNADRNGEYEAYASQTYDYGDDVLNGIFKLDSNNELYADGDVKTSDGVITRKYKSVTYNGSEAWAKDTDVNGYNRYYIADNSVKVLSDYRDNIVNSKGYPIASTYAFGNTGLGDIAISAYSIAGSSNWVYFCFKTSLNISTLADFKAWLTSNPVTVVLPLATPTTEQGDPFPSPQVCYPDGTEEYVTSNNVPVGHETRYEL